MTAPRTVAGQAAISAMRPFVKRALTQTIVAIEDEAIAPYLAALREADRVLESLAAQDPTSTWDAPSRVDFVKRAEAAHRLAVLVEHGDVERDELDHGGSGTHDASTAALIDRAGPFTLRLDSSLSPFASLVESILYQQLHGKAAATIHRRTARATDPAVPASPAAASGFPSTPTGRHRGH